MNTNKMPRRLLCVAMGLLAACGGNTGRTNTTAPAPTTGTIVGAITSNQGGALAPLAGVHVVVTPAAGTALGAVTTSSAGSYVTPDVPVTTDDGIVMLSALPANCTTPSPTSYAGLTGGDTVIVNVAVTCTTPAGPPGSVTGTVTSSVGGALSGVKVTVTPNGSAALTPVTPNAAGVYTVTNVPAGAGTVTVSALPGYCTNPAPVPYTGLTNAMSVTTDIVVQCVAPTGTISGVVTSSQGGALAGIGVNVAPTGATTQPAATTASGAYTIHGVPIGNGTISLTGVPASCAAPLATPYTGLTYNGTVTVNIVVTCAQPGSLTVTISPMTSMAPITVSGPAGYTRTLTATATLTGLAPGTYAVTAPAVESPDPIVPSIYTATITGSPATVPSGGSANVTVAYALAGGTGGLWVMTLNQSLIGELTASQLRAGGAQSLTVSGAPGSGTGLGLFGAAFDAQGTLWITDNGNNRILGYTASQLASGALVTPSVAITATGMISPYGLGFDPSGNLWISASNEVIGLSPEQLATSATVVPAMTVSNSALVASGPLAFDAGGTLWVGCTASGSIAVCGYTPSQLTTGGAVAPTYTVVVGGLTGSYSLNGLAFDQAGTLWAATMLAARNVNLGGVLNGYTPGQLTAGGRPVPTSQLVFVGGIATQFGGIAFDASGDLWLGEASSILELTPAQLAAGGSPTATNSVTLPANTAFTLAFDPHATNLPIYNNRVRGALRSAIRR